MHLATHTHMSVTKFAFMCSFIKSLLTIYSEKCMNERQTKGMLTMRCDAMRDVSSYQMTTFSSMKLKCRFQSHVHMWLCVCLRVWMDGAVDVLSLPVVTCYALVTISSLEPVHMFGVGVVVVFFYAQHHIRISCCHCRCFASHLLAVLCAVWYIICSLSQSLLPMSRLHRLCLQLPPSSLLKLITLKCTIQRHFY